MKNLLMILCMFSLASCATTPEPPEPNLTDSPKASYKVAPKYPKEALSTGVEGSVEFRFDVDSNGKPINIQITRSWPKDVFDESATEALRQWTYLVKDEQGNPLKSKNIAVQMRFKLYAPISDKWL
ncbi:energy transducer TonB [Vibrio fortis]|uniref:energy transducer TonB n=1 Tax=Vibrio fortis TaxID=212667 RepID=UPI0038CD1551